MACKREFYLQKNEITLTSRELDLLKYLATHRDQALSCDDIYRDVWHRETGSSAIVVPFILRLVQKLNGSTAAELENVIFKISISNHS